MVFTRSSSKVAGTSISALAQYHSVGTLSQPVGKVSRASLTRSAYSACSIRSADTADPARSCPCCVSWVSHQFVHGDGGPYGGSLPTWRGGPRCRNRDGGPLAQGARDQLALHPSFKLTVLPTCPRHPQAKSLFVCILHQHERYVRWAAGTLQQTMCQIVNSAVVAPCGDRREVHRAGHRCSSAWC